MEREITNSAATKRENGAAECGTTLNGVPPSCRDDRTQGNAHTQLNSYNIPRVKRTHETEKQPATGEGAAESGRCRALYSFTSEQENELSLKEGIHTLIQTAGDPGVPHCFPSTGDILDVYIKGEKGWWYGGLNGKTGHFPCTYVEELSASEQVQSSDS